MYSATKWWRVADVHGRMDALYQLLLHLPVFDLQTFPSPSLLGPGGGGSKALL